MVSGQWLKKTAAAVFSWSVAAQVWGRCREPSGTPWPRSASGAYRRPGKRLPGVSGPLGPPTLPTGAKWVVRASGFGPKAYVVGTATLPTLPFFVTKSPPFAGGPGGAGGPKSWRGKRLRHGARAEPTLPISRRARPTHELGLEN